MLSYIYKAHVRFTAVSFKPTRCVHFVLRFFKGTSRRLTPLMFYKGTSRRLIPLMFYKGTSRRLTPLMFYKGTSRRLFIYTYKYIIFVICVSANQFVCFPKTSLGQIMSKSLPFFKSCLTTLNTAPF